jgi:Ran GTPase-activating protein (RanGAP) involved in mRNA processing and transport
MAACSTASSKVKKLDLALCGLATQAAEVIASSLRSNSEVTELDLSGNTGIGARGTQALVEILCVNAALKVLWLNRCCVGDEGAGHLAVALRQNRTLDMLLLGGNGIRHVGAAAIAAMLPFNQTLKSLQLNDNLLGDDGVDVLSKAVPLSGLRDMWLNRTCFRYRGCAALVEMLKNGSRLQGLQVTENHMQALEEGFRCNGWLLSGAPEQYLERNKAMHLQARKSVCTLLLIRKLRRTALSSFPKEMVR